jgi:hypothetical protein
MSQRRPYPVQRDPEAVAAGDRFILFARPEDQGRVMLAAHQTISWPYKVTRGCPQRK